MVGQSAIDCNDAPVLKLERLGIDQFEIELRLERQIGERLAEITQKHVEHVVATAILGFQLLFFSQTVTKQHHCTKAYDNP